MQTACITGVFFQSPVFFPKAKDVASLASLRSRTGGACWKHSESARAWHLMAKRDCSVLFPIFFLKSVLMCLTLEKTRSQSALLCGRQHRPFISLLSVGNLSRQVPWTLTVPILAQNLSTFSEGGISAEDIIWKSVNSSTRLLSCLAGTSEGTSLANLSTIRKI